MPSQKTVISIVVLALISLGVVACLLMGMRHIRTDNHSISSNRRLASNEHDAKFAEQRPNYEIIRRTKKLHTPVKIRFVDVGEPPRAGDVFEIHVEVESSIHLGQAMWEWILPDGVTAVGSPLSGRFEVFSPGEANRIRGTFQVSDEENRRIRFVVRPIHEPGILAQGIYQTQRQLDLQREAEELARRQQQYLEENPEVLEGSR